MLQRELAVKLKKASSEDEKMKLIQEYMQKMRKVTEEIDDKKKNSLETLINKLAFEDKIKKEEFYAEKRQECMRNGVDFTESLPNEEYDDEYEKRLKEDLARLAEEQARLAAEIAKDWPPKEISQEMRDKLNSEMDARMKALNAMRPGVSDVKVKSEINDEINSHLRKRDLIDKKLKKRMKTRRNRRDSGSSIGSRSSNKTRSVTAGGHESKSGEDGTENNTESLQSEANSAAIRKILLDALDDDKLGHMDDILENFILDRSDDKNIAEKLLAKFNDDKDKLKLGRLGEKDALNTRLQDRINARRKLAKDFRADQAAKIELNKYADKFQNPDSKNDETRNKTKRTNLEDPSKLISQLEQIQEKQDFERANVEKELNDALESEKLKLEVEISDKLNQEQEEIMRAVEQQNSDADKSELDRILSQAQKNADRLKQSAEESKARQFQALRERREQQKARKLKMLDEDHELQTDELLNRLQNERQKKSVVKARSGSVSETDLLAKHAAEMDQSMVNAKNELEIGLKKSRAALRKKREHLRQAYAEKYAEEKQDAENSGMAHSELVQKLEEIEYRKSIEISKFDADTDGIVAQARIDPRLELEQASKKLALREQHLKELADSVKNISGARGKMLAKAAEEAEKAAVLSKENRLKIVAQADVQLAKAKKEKLDSQKEANLARQSEVDRRQAELDRKMEVEKEKEMNRLGNNLENREQALDDKFSSDIQRIRADSKLDEDERERLLREAEEASSRMKTRLASDRTQMQKNLLAKLAERKKKKYGELNEVMDLESELNGEMSISDAGLTKRIAKQLQDSDPIGSPLPDFISLENGLRELLLNHEKSLTNTTDLVNNMPNGVQLTLLDPMDKQWNLEGTLTEFPRKLLTSKQLLIFRHSQYVSDVVSKVLKMEPVKIKVAKTLPNNDYHLNSFRRSFYYDFVTKTLWIRDARLNAPDELSIVIAHCMSHIKHGDDFQDVNEPFVESLYTSLKYISSEGFRSKTEFESVVQPTSAIKFSENVFDQVLDSKFKVGSAKLEGFSFQKGDGVGSGKLNAVMEKIGKLSSLLMEDGISDEGKVAMRGQLKLLHKQRKELM